MAVKFQAGQPVTLIFPVGDFREFQGQHGLQYLYTVQLNGNPRDKLYATPTLHRELQAAGVAAGTLLTITKLAGNGGKYWSVESGGPGSGNDHAQPRAEQSVPLPPTQEAAASVPQGFPEDRAKQPAPATAPPDANGDEFSRLEQLLGHCLACLIASLRPPHGQVQFTSEDVRCLGTTLFLECNRKNTRPEPLCE